MTTFESIGIIKLAGSECFAFLNNQTISKIAATDTESCHYSAICNPKGRVLFSFFVFTNPDSIFIAITKELTDELFNFLNMRRFRMDVQVTKPEKIHLALGNGSPANNQYPLKLIDTEHSTETMSIWPTLFNWHLPWIEKAQQEKHIPQHLSLDEVGAIDFKKGCYPGQEIVARLHYLGEVKKRLQLIQVNEQGEMVSKNDNTGTIKWCSEHHKLNNNWFRQAVVSLLK